MKKIVKRFEISVSNIKEASKYFEQNNLSYEIVSDKIINVYDNMNISELAIALSSKNCTINEFHEKKSHLKITI